MTKDEITISETKNPELGDRHMMRIKELPLAFTSNRLIFFYSLGIKLICADDLPTNHGMVNLKKTPEVI